MGVKTPHFDNCLGHWSIFSQYFQDVNLNVSPCLDRRWEPAFRPSPVVKSRGAIPQTVTPGPPPLPADDQHLASGGLVYITTVVTQEGWRTKAAPVRIPKGRYIQALPAPVAKHRWHKAGRPLPGCENRPVGGSSWWLWIPCWRPENSMPVLSVTPRLKSGACRFSKPAGFRFNRGVGWRYSRQQLTRRLPGSGADAPDGLTSSPGCFASPGELRQNHSMPKQ